MGDPHTHTHSQAAAQLVDANRPASIIIFSSFSIVLCYWFAIHSLAFLLSFARDSDPRGRTLRLCCVLSPGVAPIFRPVGHDSYHTTGPKRDTQTHKSIRLCTERCRDGYTDAERERGRYIVKRASLPMEIGVTSSKGLLPFPRRPPPHCCVCLPAAGQFLIWRLNAYFNIIIWQVVSSRRNRQNLRE